MTENNVKSARSEILKVLCNKEIFPIGYSGYSKKQNIVYKIVE